jgi:hypothetical protein
MSILLFVLNILAGCSPAFGIEEIPVTIPEQNRRSLIKFSHRYHLQDIGLFCTDCHKLARGSSSASDNILPKEENCADCHLKEVEDEAKCGKCHQDNAEHEPFENPERVIDFPHKFHLEKAGLSCQDCHHGMNKTDYARREHWPTMPECLSCHQDADAPADCNLCHPKVEVIRPVSHRADWLHEHDQHVRSEDMPCAQCHQDTWCEDCHVGATTLELMNPVALMASGGSQNRGRTGQIIQRQHDLNYRFVHPLDAVGKERQCATCHAKKFCVDCHRVEGDEQRFKPVWHGQLPGVSQPWVLIGVGSGGGRHADWGRKDMERCVACHDVEGDDPSCIQCHVDFDGVKGTDPKTHPGGFAGRLGEGEFHTDPTALCYACHVNTSASGVGFCGYCHQ